MNMKGNTYTRLKSFVKRIVPKSIWQVLRQKRNRKLSVRYPLIKMPETVFERVYHIKDVTWEKMYAPAVFGRAKERTFEVISPSQDIWLVRDAIVSQDSDVVRCQEGAWWDKYNDEDFITRAKPWDINVVSFTNKDIYILPCRDKVNISGTTLSLLGVFENVWSHFVFQFLCKLYYAGEAGLLNQEITILMYDYTDPNINEIIDNYINRFPMAKILRAQANVDYCCEKLLCAPSLSTNYNETRFSIDYGFVIPQNVMIMLMNHLVQPYASMVTIDSTMPTRLFITRSTYRILSNKEEVEGYFKEKGFCIVEGANLSMEEKASLFYNATEIVGMHCSAWQNLIFCNKVRCLMMSNYHYSGETCFYTMAKTHVSKWINVCGQDESSELMTNYYIPLEKIKAAYEELIS